MISKDLWTRLTPANRRRCQHHITRLEIQDRLRRTFSSPAVRYAAPTIFLCFAMLQSMPKHPIAFPTAIGGSIAFTIIASSGIKLLATMRQIYG